MKKLILIFLLGSLQSNASTFVGNGGHAGDIEAQVAFKIIQETLRQIHENSSAGDKLCVCFPDLEGHSICDTLKKLNESQGKYCSQQLRENAAGLLLTTQKISSQGFLFTRDRIQVESRKSKYRDADAVANFHQQTLILNQDRFTQMQDYEKVFLLVHELGHLHSWKGESIKDDQSLGPFTGDEGGRQFLNSVAAAVTMQALEYRTFNNYKDILERSQGHKVHWLELSSRGTENKKVQLGVNKTTGSSFSYRYQFSEPWGVSFHLANQNGSQGHLTSTTAKEFVSAQGVLLSYRLFPFKDPLRYFGQSHFIFSAGLEDLGGRYEVTDTYTPAEARANSLSWSVGASYYLPIKYNFWVTFNWSKQGHDYSYKIPFRSIDVKSDSTFNLGVSYGF